jgi:serine/threonine protein phosphatase PrpC
VLVIAPDVFSDTDQGRQRRGNEDSHFARRPLFAVADGMGGAQAGEIASGIAVSVFEHGIPEGDGSVEERLASLVQDANAQIHELSRTDEERAGMGTTLTAAYLGDDDELSIAHVGDSRLYRLRDGQIERLTRDHSLVEELVQEGRLTPEEAEEHPQRSIITRALGPEQHVLVDHFTHRVQEGDVYLICSDGLTSMVRDDQRLAELIQGSATLREAGRTLIDAANAAGGRDNITVILFRIADVPVGGTPQTAAAGAATGASPAPGGEQADPTQQTMIADSAPTVEEVRAAVASAPPAAASGLDFPTRQPDRRVPRTPAAGTGKPPRRRRGRRARRILRGLAISLVVLTPIVVGAWIASQSVYFLGTDDQGFVTLYRGMPYDLPGGAELYSVNYTSGVPVSTLTDKVKQTVTAHKLRSRDDAADLVKQIEQGKLVGQQGQGQ